MVPGVSVYFGQDRDFDCFVVKDFNSYAGPNGDDFGDDHPRVGVLWRIYLHFRVRVVLANIVPDGFSYLFSVQSFGRLS